MTDFNTPLLTFDPLLKIKQIWWLEREEISERKPRKCPNLWKMFGSSTVPSILETTKNHKEPDPDYRADVATTLIFLAARYSNVDERYCGVL